MLEVDINKIVPVTDARDSLNKIVDEVSAGDILYVLTVNGKPSAVVVGVHHLEKLTGEPTDSLMSTASQPTPIDQPIASPSDSFAQPVGAQPITGIATTDTVGAAGATANPTDTTATIADEDLFAPSPSAVPATPIPETAAAPAETTQMPAPPADPALAQPAAAGMDTTQSTPTYDNQLKTPQPGDLNSLNN